MRTFGSFIFGVIATVAIIAAIPLWWAQQNVIATDGYHQLTAGLAKDSAVQEAVAHNLILPAQDAVAAEGAKLPASEAGRLKDLNTNISKTVTAYTQSPEFTKTFAGLNDFVHQQLVSGSGGVSVDLGPLAKEAFASGNADVKRVGTEVAKKDIKVDIASQTGSTLLTRLPLITSAAQLAAGTAVAAFILSILLARRRGSVLIWLGAFTALATGVSWLITKLGANTLAGNSPGITGALRKYVVTSTTASMAGWQIWAFIGSAAAIVIGIVWLVATRRRTSDDGYYDDDGYPEQGYQEPAYADPAYTEGAYPEPAYQEPVYAESGYQNQGYADPGHQQQGYPEAYPEPAYPDPSRGYPPAAPPAQSYQDAQTYQDPGAYPATQAYPPQQPAPRVRPRGGRHAGAPDTSTEKKSWPPQ